MGTIAQKLAKLLSTKQAIKQAIIDKGVTVNESDAFSLYPSKIAQIEGGGGGTEDWVITDCSYLFYYGVRKELYKDLIKHVKNPTTLKYMFSYCDASAINWSSTVDTSNVTSVYNMFAGSYFTTISGLENMNTSNCTDFGYMFDLCRYLTTLDTTKFNTSKATSVKCMFRDCKLLTSLDFTNWDMDLVTSTQYMMDNCIRLTSVQGLNFNGIKTTTEGNPFGSSAMTKLSSVKFKEGKSFGNPTVTTEIIFNMTAVRGSFTADSFVEMINSIAANTSGYTRTIKLYTNVYNKLSDEQKALATAKNYNLSYGKS